MHMHAHTQSLRKQRQVAQCGAAVASPSHPSFSPQPSSQGLGAVHAGGSFGAPPGQSLPGHALRGSGSIRNGPAPPSPRQCHHAGLRPPSPRPCHHGRAGAHQQRAPSPHNHGQRTAESGHSHGLSPRVAVHSNSVFGPSGQNEGHRSVAVTPQLGGALTPNRPGGMQGSSTGALLASHARSIEGLGSDRCAAQRHQPHERSTARSLSPSTAWRRPGTPADILPPPVSARLGHSPRCVPVQQVRVAPASSGSNAAATAWPVIEANVRKNANRGGCNDECVQLPPSPSAVARQHGCSVQLKAQPPESPAGRCGSSVQVKALLPDSPPAHGSSLQPRLMPPESPASRCGSSVQLAAMPPDSPIRQLKVLLPDSPAPNYCSSVQLKSVQPESQQPGGVQTPKARRPNGAITPSPCPVEPCVRYEPDRSSSQSGAMLSNAVPADEEPLRPILRELDTMRVEAAAVLMGRRPETGDQQPQQQSQQLQQHQQHQQQQQQKQQRQQWRPALACSTMRCTCFFVNFAKASHNAMLNGHILAADGKTILPRLASVIVAALVACSATVAHRLTDPCPHLSKI